MELAQFLAAVDEKVRAYDVATFILHHRASWQWSRDSVVPLMAELEAELPPEAVTAAQEQWREKTLEGVVGEILREALY